MSSSRMASAVFLFSLSLLALSIPFSIAGDNSALALALAAFTAILALDREKRDQLRELKRDPVFLAASLVVLTALASALTSEDKSRALRDWKSYWVLSIYVLVGFYLPGERWRRRLFWLLFSSATLSAVVALIQHAGGLDLGWLHIAAKRRASSTLFVMTFAGVSYQIAAAEFALLLREGRPPGERMVLGAGLAAQLLALLFSLVRGAYLAVIPALLAPAFFLRKRRTVLAALALVMLVGLYCVVDPTLNTRIHSVVDNLHSPRDKSVRTRYVLWDISLELIARHPIFGVGMGDFSIEARKILRGRFVNSITDAHNIYLHVLATRGLVGFIPFCLFWVAAFTRLKRVLSSSPAGPFARHIAAGAMGAALALLVGGLTENNIEDSEVFTAFLFLLSLAVWRQRGR